MGGTARPPGARAAARGDQTSPARRAPPPPPFQNARAKASTAKFYEQDIYGSVMARTRKLVAAIEPAAQGASARAQSAHAALAAVAAAAPRERRTEREALSGLVEKKRETLLANIGIAIKREEIARLEAELAGRAAALTKAEENLEEDAVHFDAFLENNDRVTAGAVARAEEAARQKNAKAHEVKKLRHAIAAIAAEKGRVMDDLAEKRAFKAFLDALTPEEHFSAVAARQAARRAELRAAALAERAAAWADELASREAALRARFADERKASLRLGRAYTMPDVPALALAAMPPPPTLADTPEVQLSAAELEVPPYFTAPAQLKAVFVAQEEANLFLIQQVQDTEAALEELAGAAAETAAAAARADAAHAGVVAVLAAQIRAEEAKAATLARAAEGGGGGTALDAIQPIARARVAGSFERAGFKASASSDIISMLTAMEARLETLLAEVAALDAGYVAGKLKERERERRTAVREARLRAQAELHDARLAKMVSNALAPPAKRAGKPVMYRSVLPPPAAEAAEEEAEAADVDEARFFE